MEYLIDNFANYGFYINFFFIFYICLKARLSNIISREVFCLLVISCLGPILFKFIPFFNLMFPDQGGYYDNITILRDNYSYDLLRHSNNSKQLSLILSIVPIPLVESVSSATFLNKFLIVFLIIYLIQFKYITNAQSVILLLYPSLFLYSSLMLKETTVVFLIILSYIFLIKDKYFFCLACLGLTALIKFHLALLFAIIYLIYPLFYLKFIKKYLIYLILTIFTLLAIYIQLDYSLIDKLNIYIYNFNLESNDYSAEALAFSKNYIKLDISSIYNIITLIISYFFKPFLYKIENFSQLFQSLENIFILSILIYYLKKLYLKNIAKTYYIISSILIISLPYAIIVSNIGTLSRYRFTVLIIFLFIIFIELNKFKKKNEKY